MSDAPVRPQPPPYPPDTTTTYVLCVCDHTCTKNHAGGQWVAQGTRKTHESKTVLIPTGYYSRGRGTGASITPHLLNTSGRRGRGLGLGSSATRQAVLQRGLPSMRRGITTNRATHRTYSKRARSPSPIPSGPTATRLKVSEAGEDSDQMNASLDNEMDAVPVSHT